jgi:hypothetical protein
VVLNSKLQGFRDRVIRRLTWIEKRKWSLCFIAIGIQKKKKVTLLVIEFTNYTIRVGSACYK